RLALEDRARARIALARVADRPDPRLHPGRGIARRRDRRRARPAVHRAENGPGSASRALARRHTRVRPDPADGGRERGPTGAALSGSVTLARQGRAEKSQVNFAAGEVWVMPRSIWKGVMSFGMVAIPVRLYLATESSSKVSFNLLCPEHRSRIKNKRWCVEGDHEVAWGDVVRGYEYEKGNYVELTDEDLEKLPLRSSKAIDITGFIKDDELPGALYYQSAYYLEPEK